MDSMDEITKEKLQQLVNNYLQDSSAYTETLHKMSINSSPFSVSKESSKLVRNTDDDNWVHIATPHKNGTNRSIEWDSLSKLEEAFFDQVKKDNYNPCSEVVLDSSMYYGRSISGTSRYSYDDFDIYDATEVIPVEEQIKNKEQEILELKRKLLKAQEELEDLLAEISTETALKPIKINKE